MAGNELSLARVTQSALSAVAENFRRHPVRNGSCLALYGLGLFLALGFAGFAASSEAQALYDLDRPLAHELTAVQTATSLEWETRQAFYASRGWFWSCSTHECTSARQRHDLASASLAEARGAVMEAQKRANLHVGLFSTKAVDEARALFWESAESGKKFAVRQTTYDFVLTALFSGLGRGGDDENTLGLVFRMIINAMWNVIAGITGTFLSFVFTVSRVISMFSVSWGESIVFFLGAFLAALALSMTACIACCGLTAGVVAVPAIVVASARLAAGREQRRLRRDY